ncbi:hypothetical protein JCM19235_3682 [Vibrio maritimus]|uniref:Uncharacterized protein n=1 Tax=Vibrio maritimus TaxID=990268 RepID=A0A090RYX5_9VIBR|nr:hypothetical protein JCM19235_3682 [Vibrio maritimus]
MKTINVEDYASAIELHTLYQVTPMELEVNEAREMLWHELEPTLAVMRHRNLQIVMLIGSDIGLMLQSLY